METSIFLAKAWGLYLTLIALSLLLNKNNVKMLFDIFEHKEALFLSGITEVVIGVLTVLSHNVWSADWRGLVTLLGWAALIRGFARIVWVEQVASYLKKVEKIPWVSNLPWVALVIGLYLVYSGFSN